MKKSLYSLFAALFLLTACFDENNNVYTGPSLLEIDNQRAINVAFEGDAIDTNTKAAEIKVNLVGPQRAEAVTVGYEIVASESTAIQGVHFTNANTGTVTLPANSSTVIIPINFVAGGFERGEKVTLTVQLTSASGLAISENYRKFTVGAEKVLFCPVATPAISIAGRYSVNEPGYGAYEVLLVADATEQGVFYNDNFWDWGSPTRTVRYVFSLNTDQTITIPTQDWVDGGGTTRVIAGTGKYDGCNLNTFSVDYTVRTKSSNALVDQNTHTFTRIP